MDVVPILAVIATPALPTEAVVIVGGRTYIALFLSIKFRERLFN